MVVITVKIDDDVNRKFRTYVKRKYGTKKGVIGAAITEAMKQKMEEESARESFMKLLDRGFDLGSNIGKIRRDEIYDRNR